jgi:hypothetical protein
VITFRSARFDVSGEPPNPINPIPGESVLRWLLEKLPASGYGLTKPKPEDWGWYVDVRGNGASYLVGASGDAGDGRGDVDWTVQIHRHRSLKDKLTGRNQLRLDDPLSATIERVLREDAAVTALEIDRAP